jgi:hypothetical protein
MTTVTKRCAPGDGPNGSECIEALASSVVESPHAMLHAITPTGVAEALAERLVCWIDDLRSTFAPALQLEADALRAGRGSLRMAETMLNDLQHIGRRVDEYLDEQQVAMADQIEVFSVAVAQLTPEADLVWELVDAAVGAGRCR